MVGKLGLVNEMVSLRDVRSRDVVAQKESDEGGLELDVFPESCSSERRQELSADFYYGRRREKLVKSGIIEVDLGRERIQCPTVKTVDLLYKRGGERSSLLVLLLVQKVNLSEKVEVHVDLVEHILADLVDFGFTLHFHHRSGLSKHAE